MSKKTVMKSWPACLISLLRFSLVLCLTSAGAAAAQDVPAAKDPSPKAQAKAEALKAEAPSPNKKAYDALYSDILRSLPEEGKMKVDSARGGERKPEPSVRKDPPNVEDLKKEALEKRKKELDDLPPEVKARVDKALADLDNRRREKQTEFKELKK